jgi:hypothetical protein
MFHRSWALLILAMLAISGGLCPQLASAQECTDLTTSRLKVYRLTVDQVTVHATTRAEIEEIVGVLAGTLSTHPLMAIVDALDTHVATKHRIIERVPKAIATRRRRSSLASGWRAGRYSSCTKLRLISA